MKKFIGFIIIGLLPLFLFAQTENKNVIKLFPTSPLFGKTTIGYERVINENGSFIFNLGLPTGTKLDSYMPEDAEEGIDLEHAKINGLLIMPGYRFNMSKRGAPLGFYMETYLKYENFNMDVAGDFIDDENERFAAQIDGKYSGIGAGFLMGAEWLISDVVSIDFSFFGLELKSGSVDVKYTDLSGEVDLSDVEVELDDSLSDIPIIGKKIEITSGSDYVQVEVPNQLLPGFRFALSLGIAF